MPIPILKGKGWGKVHVSSLPRSVSFARERPKVARRLPIQVAGYIILQHVEVL
jgi:hypothetical protein